VNLSVKRRLTGPSVAEAPASAPRSPSRSSSSLPAPGCRSLIANRGGDDCIDVNSDMKMAYGKEVQGKEEDKKA
jgi:hypothetical protein